VTAAIGSAAGAGLPVLAGATTAVYFLVALAFPVLTRRMPRSATAISVIRVRYPDGRGILREILQVTTGRGFAVDDVSTQVLDPTGASGTEGTGHRRMIEVSMHVHGRQPLTELAAALSELHHVHAVVADDVNAAEP
jgi:putative Mg2+ transporter-C (MgtC) family protein